MKYTSNTIKINWLFILVVVLVFVLFFVKLTYVATSEIVEGTNLKELAKNRSIVKRSIKAERGRIYDNAGELLAQNVNSYTVFAYLSKSRTTDEKYPKHVVDPAFTAERLETILLPLNKTMTREYIESLLRTEGAYQVELGPGGRGITENVKQKIEALDLPGIDFIKTTKRYYQNGDFASYIIGYAKKYKEEMVGELGIEGYCDRYLKGKNGSITYQQDAYGYQMAGDDKITYIEEAQDGYDVYLTLDKQVQIFIDNSVQEFQKYDPNWVVLTIADAKTGAIIGSSTYPSFDPNKLNIENYNNPLTSYSYEPGSTMKIFSFMSAMEEGKYTGDEVYQSGIINVEDYKIKDWNKIGWGRITFDTGFTYSSNTAAVRLAQRVGKRKLRDYYNKLGFGELTNIELSGELKGEVNFEYATELAAASYGQGLTITPIQMIKALTTITNDGTVLKPYVIDKIVDTNKGETVYHGKRTEEEKVYSTSTINKIVELMDKTVNGEDKAATGKVYSTDAVRLIGKTGTAHYSGGNGKYLTGTYNNIRSFAGVFPKESPEYIIYVAVKDFKGTSKNMGSIVKSLVESISKYRNLDERESDKDESKIIKLDNYLNTSIEYAEKKLQNKGVTVITIGNGNKVIDQYPKKNTKISQQSKVFLVTNGNEYRMPNMYGWSSNEFVSFCNIINVPYEINGYGYVQSTNIKENDIIDTSNVIVADMLNISAESIITS